MRLKTAELGLLLLEVVYYFILLKNILSYNVKHCGKFWNLNITFIMSACISVWPDHNNDECVGVKGFKKFWGILYVAVSC